LASARPGTRRRRPPRRWRRPAEPAFALYPAQTRAGLDPTLREEFVERLTGLRRAYLAQGGAAATTSCLQILDLGQLRFRFGRRWPQIRHKALGIAEAAIQRDFGKGDLYVAVSETCYYLFRLGVKRRAAERRGRLLAAEITERLCGAIPGGVAAGVRRRPFDFGQGLAGGRRLSSSATGSRHSARRWTTGS
jgi:hypothetical protein